MNKIADLCNQLRNLGCAVCCFTPEELAGAEPDMIEDFLCSRGWDAIETEKQYLSDQD